MKTTVDLPADILKEMKVRAASEGRKLKDFIAELLRTALAHDKNARPKVKKLKRGQMPIVKGGHKAKPGHELTPERVFQLLYGNGQP